jgi:hypothetical protein
MPLSFGGHVSTRSRFVIEITFDCDSSPGETSPFPGSIGAILQRNLRLTSLSNS